MTETCRNGHERTPENTKIRANGTRVCVLCRRNQGRIYSEGFKKPKMK